jgi:hypothetical protein
MPRGSFFKAKEDSYFLYTIFKFRAQSGTKATGMAPMTTGFTLATAFFFRTGSIVLIATGIAGTARSHASTFRSFVQRRTFIASAPILTGGIFPAGTLLPARRTAGMGPILHRRTTFAFLKQFILHGSTRRIIP